LAVVRTTEPVMSGPSKASAQLGVVLPHRPITGEQTVLPIIGRKTVAGGSVWLEVRLPGRPNGHTGWISKAGTASSSTSWKIVVDIGRRRVVVYNNGQPIRGFRAIVGTPSTPTPLGQYFVEEVVALPAQAAGAPDALALSARSNVYQEFDGGPGQVAIHGLANIGGTLGTAVSHGCVRLAASAMQWLVLHIAPGVPVTIAA
jgi:lipoprotein-anchoring transpeptidase ErfK/SrfK